MLEMSSQILSVIFKDWQISYDPIQMYLVKVSKDLLIFFYSEELLIFFYIEDIFTL